MPDTPKIEMTSTELQRLKEELAERESRRPRIIEAIATARAHGDLSENAEYHAAREEQGQNEAQIQKLQYQIDNAVIVEVQDDGVVGPGKLVTFRFQGDTETETYLLGQLAMKKAGDFEVLTPESPIGQALMGHSAGETVEARIRDTEQKLEIVEVRTP